MTTRRHPHRKRNIIIAVVLIAAVLIGARAYLPIWLTKYVNNTINSMEGYQGEITDVDIALYRGAYQIHGLRLDKVDKGLPVPFLKIRTTDLSIQWKALLHGEIVSEVYLDKPELHFATGSSGSSQTGGDVDWTRPIKDLMPIDINLVDIKEGTLAYHNFSASPEVNIYINNLSGTMRNLRNVEEEEVALPSSIDVKGTSIGGGAFQLEGKLNILKKTPDMDLAIQLENADLTAINDYAQSLAAIDFHKGTFHCYSELVIKNGAISGYIKPMAEDLEVVNLQQDDNPIEIIWESVAGFVLEIFQNQPNDRFATKVPLSGSLDNVEAGILPALGSIIYNAFIQAIAQGTDNEVDFRSAPEEEETS